MLKTRPFFYTFACFTSVVFAPMNSARAWGDEGHKTIALIAEHYLTPAAQSPGRRIARRGYAQYPHST